MSNTASAEGQSGGQDCISCHPTYADDVNNSMHNQIKNAAAPSCTDCHKNYDNASGHNDFIVNESNTCRNCHMDGINGFYERHSSSSDCTTCHFANTTISFSLNTSLYTHDHNMTIEYNFYEYNQSGIPFRTNNGTGAGMFPYYTCTLTCHNYNATSGIEGKIDIAAGAWLESAHARSLHMIGDNKMSCTKCKSPANFNATTTNWSSLIAQEDWQGIQCRVCHNLHDTKFPNNTGPGGFPIAFYNGTASSLMGHAVYEQVPNTTALCEKCHYGTSHDSKFAGTHKDTAGFNCTSCHMNSSFNSELHKFEVRNTTSNVTGCEVCHNASDHTFQYTSMHTGIVECVACHDQTISRNATGFAVSPDNYYGIYRDLTTNKWTTYKVSHGTAATWPLHNITRSVSCDKCHGSFSVYSGWITISCLCRPPSCDLCHADISSADLGLHSSLNGSSSIDEGDCRTCHYQDFPMVKGAVNNSNTYFCADCHTTNGTGPNKSSQARTFEDKKHGKNACLDCHAADGIYHQDNPRGSVANSTYIVRYNTSNTNATDCADCHYAANLDDAPFNAPGGGEHINSSGGACETGGCHAGGTDMIKTIHDIGSLNSSLKPTISVPTFSSSSVNQGTDVTVTATVNFTNLYAIVDGAQYRIMSETTEIRSWTPMLALDGNFNGAGEVATAVMNTDIPPGTYTVEVRGMAGGPAHNTSERYYPINGDVSATNSTTMTVLPLMGYINGTVTCGIMPIEGVFVSVPGAGDTTKYDGTYSLRVPEGTYTINASKQPTHYDTSVAEVVVTPMNTTIANISICQKPIGTISGTVRNV